MMEMTCFHVTVIASRQRCVNMVFRANDKVLIRSLYQSAIEFVQTSDHFLVLTRPGCAGKTVVVDCSVAVHLRYGRIFIFKDLLVTSILLNLLLKEL